MRLEYLTIKNPAEGYHQSRNSRFLAFGYPVSTADEINLILAAAKKKYHDARHHCYAYRLGPAGETYRMNDDGEPSGTAGKPIYNQILAFDLSDILVVVVRYFGGTLLGTGGLKNAYKLAAVSALEKAETTVKCLEDYYDLDFPFEQLNTVMKIIKDFNIKQEYTDINNRCRLNILVKRKDIDQVRQRLSLISGLILNSR